MNEKTEYGGDIQLTHCGFDKDSLWHAYELQEKQYQTTKKELEKQGVKLKKVWWRFFVPNKFEPGLIQWRASSEKIE